MNKFVDIITRVSEIIFGVLLLTATICISSGEIIFGVLLLAAAIGIWSIVIWMLG